MTKTASARWAAGWSPSGAGISRMAEKAAAPRSSIVGRYVRPISTRHSGRVSTKTSGGTRALTDSVTASEMRRLERVADALHPEPAAEAGEPAGRQRAEAGAREAADEARAAAPRLRFERRHARHQIVGPAPVHAARAHRSVQMREHPADP